MAAKQFRIYVNGQTEAAEQSLKAVLAWLEHQGVLTAWNRRKVLRLACGVTHAANASIVVKRTQ